ncbi:hypothetical protein ACJW31_08G022400 [Castanea mollissima]
MAASDSLLLGPPNIYRATGNPCLNFFFHVVPSTPPEEIVECVHKAWSHDPLTTLKLISNLRGVRGTRKSNKERFYTTALWLHKHHPKTLALNARTLYKFGLFEDLLEILYRILEGESRYNKDPIYRFLHDTISDVFAEMLKADTQALNAGKRKEISLAAKWCPAIDSTYDKSLLICESIACRVFPKESDPEYQTLEEADYAYRILGRLRKKVLEPLCKVLYMSANMWETLPYNSVPSVAMKNYKSHFLRHDDVKHGDSTIAAGALLPHEIIASLKDSDGGEKGKLSNCITICNLSESMSGDPMEVCVALGLMISELSKDLWKGQVITFDDNPKIQRIQGESLYEKTSFIREMECGGSTNFQKVFDEILKVAVEANLSEDQLIQKVFVFSDMEFNEASEHCYGYDSESGRETDYEVIQREFREKGYNKVPEIVFWNLRGCLDWHVLSYITQKS